jgi:hypothetical protein
VRGATTTVAVKERSPLTPVIAALAALAVTGVAASLAIRDDDRTAAAPADPEHVVREYFQAFRARDCEAAVDLVDTDGRPGEPDRGSVVDACEQAHDAEPAIERTELLAADLVGRNGDRATVRTEIREGDQLVPSAPDEVPLVRIDGHWRVDLGEADAGEVPAGSPAPTPAPAPAPAPAPTPERAGGGAGLPGAGAATPSGTGGSGAATPTPTAAPSGGPGESQGQGNGNGNAFGHGNGNGNGQRNANGHGNGGANGNGRAGG